MTKKKRKSTDNKNNTIVATIPKLKEGEVAYLSNIGGNYVVSEFKNDILNKSSVFENYLDLSNYDIKSLKHLYDRILENESKSYSTTQEELSRLAKNTQTDMEKIIKINGIVKYNINKDDIIGKTIEVIENNVNTKFTINYPNVNGLNKNAKKKEIKMKEELKKAIEKFNEQIDIPSLIVECVSSVYTEGNYIFYLKGDANTRYGIIKYPLGYVEISNRFIDGEPIVVFNINKLKTEISSSISKYGNMKAKQTVDILKVVEEEVKRDYPNEVYDGYKVGDSYTYLNPERVGVVRINNLGQAYGLTPIFKALSPLLTLETIDATDRKNISAKAKKIIFQKMRKECMDEGRNIDLNAVGYAQASLLQAMQNDVVVYTGNPYVESLEILEPQTDPTSNDVVLSNRNRVFNALGISFVTNESKQSMNTVKISYEDLLKTINKITRPLESVINKFYRQFCAENGFPVEYSPTIKIHDTKLLDIDSLLKLVDLYYSKIGVSYKTVFENLGLDYNEEFSRRKEENDNDLENVFFPHSNSYTSNSNEIINNETDKNSNNSKKSEDEDKALDDKGRREAIV